MNYYRYDTHVHTSEVSPCGKVPAEGKKMRTAPPELLDGVEGFNGNPRHDSRNDKTFAFCLEHNLYLSSGSDAHQPEDVGRGGMGLTRRIRSGREYVELFRTGEPMDILFKR